MKARDNWNKVASNIGKDSEFTDDKIKAFAGLWPWGAGEVARNLEDKKI